MTSITITASCAIIVEKSKIFFIIHKLPNFLYLLLRLIGKFYNRDESKYCEKHKEVNMFVVVRSRFTILNTPK